MENMTKYPEWVLKFREKGTAIHFLKGKYYLYKISSKWDAEKKRSKKITEKFLGTITPEGLVLPKTERIKQHFNNISVKEYGASNYLYSIHNDIINALKITFPNAWQELFLCAFFRLLYKSPIKNLDFHYQNSYLSELLPKTKMNDKHISQIFKEVGIERSKIVEFFKQFVTPNEFLLIDTTHINSLSRKIIKTKVGYNSKRNFNPQMNAMFIFSVKRKQPVYYRLLSGNIREIKAMKLSIQESGLEKAVIISDKGFYSKANKENLEKEELKYIIPLRRSSSLIDYSIIKQQDNKKYDGYFIYHQRIIWHHTIKNEKDKTVIFIDNELKINEDKDYLLRIENQRAGYNKEKFFENQHKFGTISIITNLMENSAEEVYKYYKSRCEIETLFDTFKNVLDADRTYMQSDEQIETWMFVNYLALMFYYNCYNLLLENKLLTKYSTSDILLFLSEIKKLKIDKTWYLSEVSNKYKELFKKLNITIT